MHQSLVKIYHFEGAKNHSGDARHHSDDVYYNRNVTSTSELGYLNLITTPTCLEPTDPGCGAAWKCLTNS